MARGSVVGEQIISQAGTDDFREGFERVYGADVKPKRGRWVWDPEAGCLVNACDYRPPVRALDAPIIADRIHEGTTLDDGDRVRDLGSRRKRREFLRETGLADAADYSPQYRERAAEVREREADRRVDASAEAAARKLHQERKWRE